MNATTESTTTRSFLAVLLVGVLAGVLAGVAMLVTMGILRLECVLRSLFCKDFNTCSTFLHERRIADF